MKPNLSQLSVQSNKRAYVHTYVHTCIRAYEPIVRSLNQKKLVSVRACIRAYELIVRSPKQNVHTSQLSVQSTQRAYVHTCIRAYVPIVRSDNQKHAYVHTCIRHLTSRLLLAHVKVTLRVTPRVMVCSSSTHRS